MRISCIRVVKERLVHSNKREKMNLKVKGKRGFKKFLHKKVPIHMHTLSFVQLLMTLALMG